jgi:hypothetical protein
MKRIEGDSGGAGGAAAPPFSICLVIKSVGHTSTCNESWATPEEKGRGGAVAPPRPSQSSSFVFIIDFCNIVSASNEHWWSSGRIVPCHGNVPSARRAPVSTVQTRVRFPASAEINLFGHRLRLAIRYLSLSRGLSARTTVYLPVRFEHWNSGGLPPPRAPPLLSVVGGFEL